MPKTRREPAHPLNRYRVPILDRTLDLLELLTRHPDGMTLTTMTETLKIPKNSVFRIATTLTLRGYAGRDEDTKTYRASRKLLSLGHAAVGGERLTQAAAPILTALRDATGETALLGALAGNHGVMLDQVASSHPVKVVVEIGHAFPLHTAAPAKAMLAFLPDAKRDALIKTLTFKRHTKYTITSARAFRVALQMVRKQGYALDRCEESETYACAAAPVFDHRSQVVASLWISGPTDRLNLGELERFARIVCEHAQRLSRQLGCPSAPAMK